MYTEILENLFPNPDTIICAVHDPKETRLFKRSNYVFKNENYFIINSFRDSSGPRTDSNSYAQNFLFECDTISLEDQEARIDPFLPFFSKVYSGGKSFHYILRLDKPLHEYLDTSDHRDIVHFYKFVWNSVNTYFKNKYKESTFFDASCANLSRLTRLPGALRPDTGKMQELSRLTKRTVSIKELKALGFIVQDYKKLAPLAQVDESFKPEDFGLEDKIDLAKKYLRERFPNGPKTEDGVRNSQLMGFGADIGKGFSIYDGSNEYVVIDILKTWYEQFKGNNYLRHSPDKFAKTVVNGINHGKRMYGELLYRVTQNASDMLPILMESEIFFDVKDNNRTFLWHNETLEDFDVKSLDVFFKSKKGAKEYLTLPGKSRVISFDYDPFKPKFYPSRVPGIQVFNMYEPSIFQQGFLPDSYYMLPVQYENFLKHFVKYDESDPVTMESYEYILDWMAQSIQSRNEVFLVCLGEEGIGKGLFASIMKALVGEHNFACPPNDVLKSRFNGELKYKRFVNFNEIQLKSSDSNDNLKRYSDPVISIQDKNMRPIEVQNFASYFISSNRYDAIDLNKKSRRFSLIDVTDVRVDSKYSKDETDQLAEDPELLQQLYGYLMQRDIKHDMRKTFVSASKQEQIEDALLQTWEEFILDELYDQNVGKDMQVKEVQSIIMQFHRTKVSGSRIQALCKRYPDKLEYKQIGKNRSVRHVRFKPQGEQ